LAASPRIRATWITFAYLATWAFILYGLGIATPYLRADLHLTSFEAGLHASALAVGTLTAGVSADRVARWIGSNWLPDVAVAIIGTGLALIVFAPGLPESLTGAMLLGLGGGTLGTDINVRLSRSGGIGARRLLGQANALAMIMAAAAPLAIGLAASELHAWRLALAIPAAGFIALAFIRPRESEERSTVRAPSTSLPGPYWFAWLLIALVVSMEFCFVYWGSTIVTKRTGISSADATLMASLFIGGMFLGRAAVGRGLGAGSAPRVLLAVGLIVVMAGASLVWISTVPVVSGIGLLVGGLGTAALYPVGLSVALQVAPKAQFQAAARATLASGFAVLLAPSALGLAADSVGVVGAWPIVLALALAALVVLAVTPEPA
jgi:fucose permease